MQAVLVPGATRSHRSSEEEIDHAAPRWHPQRCGARSTDPSRARHGGDLARQHASPRGSRRDPRATGHPQSNAAPNEDRNEPRRAASRGRPGVATNLRSNAPSRRWYQTRGMGACNETPCALVGQRWSRAAKRRCGTMCLQKPELGLGKASPQSASSVTAVTPTPDQVPCLGSVTVMESRSRVECHLAHVGRQVRGGRS
jgi:hypothetical protein